MAKTLNTIVILLSQANDSGQREAEGKGLSRDSNYYFYVSSLEQGQKVTIGSLGYIASDGDYVVINRGIRHSAGNRAFLTRFVDNKYVEITVSDKYSNNEGLPI